MEEKEDNELGTDEEEVDESLEPSGRRRGYRMTGQAYPLKSGRYPEGSSCFANLSQTSETEENRRTKCIRIP